jgi:hypothetical protein
MRRHHTGDRKAVTIIRKSPTGMQMHDLDLTYQRNEFALLFYSLMIIFILTFKQNLGTGRRV